MSHKATNWLATIPASEIGNAQFRILFHLCDCHNPAQGCFPTQAYLIEACGISNGTLNTALNGLEAKGFLIRHRTRNGRTKRQNPTRYILGFEMDKQQEPTPETGDGSGGGTASKTSATRLRSTGDGAVSNLGADPSPISGVTRLQPTGEVTCKEPVNNQRGRVKPPFFTADERSSATDVAAHIAAGGSVRWDAVSNRVRICIEALELLTEEQRNASGFPSETGQGKEKTRNG